MPATQRPVTIGLDDGAIATIDRVAQLRRWTRSATIRHLTLDACAEILAAEGVPATDAEVAR